MANCRKERKLVQKREEKLWDFFSSTSIFFSLQSFPYFSFPYPQLSSQTFICIYYFYHFLLLTFSVTSKLVNLFSHLVQSKKTKERKKKETQVTTIKCLQTEVN